MWSVIILLISVLLLGKTCATSLKCFVGLGNTSERERQKVVQCPEDKYYVCEKMFGGGMGDQIQRKCVRFSISDFEVLLNKEAKKDKMRREGESIDPDPACYDDLYNGRKVTICHCSTDQCNGSIQTTSSLRTVLLTTLTALMMMT